MEFQKHRLIDLKIGFYALAVGAACVTAGCVSEMIDEAFLKRPSPRVKIGNSNPTTGFVQTNHPDIQIEGHLGPITTVELRGPKNCTTSGPNLSHCYPLPDGYYQIIVTSKSCGQFSGICKRGDAEKHLAIDANPPVIQVRNVSFQEGKMIVQFAVYDSVDVNPALFYERKGYWAPRGETVTVAIPPQKPGEARYPIQVQDRAGNVSTKQITIDYNPLASLLTDHPPVFTELSRNRFQLEGFIPAQKAQAIGITLNSLDFSCGGNIGPLQTKTKTETHTINEPQGLHYSVVCRRKGDRIAVSFTASDINGLFVSHNYTVKSSENLIQWANNNLLYLLAAEIGVLLYLGYHMYRLEIRKQIEEEYKQENYGAMVEKTYRNHKTVLAREIRLAEINRLAKIASARQKALQQARRQKRKK